MSKKLDFETLAAIKRSFHLSNEKIAALYGVKVSTVARMRSYEPMPAPVRTLATEPYNPIDTTAQTIEASARLRDAIRPLVNDYARRMGQPVPDWKAIDSRVVQ